MINDRIRVESVHVRMAHGIVELQPSGPSTPTRWSSRQRRCHGFLVAFSCEGRGVCPSCTGLGMAQTAAHLADRVIPPVAGGKFWAANHGSCIDALPAQMAGTNPEKQDKTASIRHTANLTGEEREEYCEGNFGAAAKVSADFCPGMGRSTFKKKKRRRIHPSLPSSRHDCR